MMIPNKIRGFLFDFDGVLAKTMEDNFRAWKSAMSCFNIEIDEKDYYLLEGMEIYEIAKKFCSQYNLEVSFSEEIVNKKESYYMKNHHMSLYPGVKEFIKKLKSRDISMGIVTAGTYERLSGTLPSGFLNLFDTLITGEKGGKGKPFPDPYLKGLLELRLNSVECIAVENAPLGIESAKKANLFCVAICSTLDRTYLKEADLIIERFLDMNKFF